jgi:DNA-directed RNA polymerase subunit RPC12/RpoP
MGSQATWASLRSLVAKRDGYRCRYCRVPTAATIEHVEARSQGGSSWADNLVLACPYCNRKKGTRDVALFLATEDWRLTPPPLPTSTVEMLHTFFAIKPESKIISTGSTNAKLELSGDDVSVLVRAHKRDQWRRMQLGPESNPAVAGAAWDFLTRHDTPPQPRRRRPPKSAFVKKR